MKNHILGESKWHFFYLGVLSVMGAVGFLVSPDSSKMRLAFFFFGLAIYSVTVAAINSPRRFWRAFALLCFLGLAITLVGAAGTTWTTYKLPALSVITAHIPQAPLLWLAYIGAPNGIHPNQVAGMLTLYFPPLLGFLLVRSRTALTAPARALDLLSVIVLSVMAIYLILSLSRGGLLAIVISVIFLLGVRRRMWGIVAFMAIALAGGGAYALLPRSMLQTFISSSLMTFNGPGESRTEIWRQAIQAIQSAPLTGIGLYNFGSIFHYNISLSPDSTFIVLHAHNEFLQAALDFGLPGAVAYTLLLADVARHSFRAGQCSEGAAAGVCYGLAAAVLAFAVYGLFDTIPLTSRVAWLTWFSIGMGAAAARVWGRGRLHDSRSGQKTLAGIGPKDDTR